MQIPVARGQLIHDLSYAFAAEKLHEAVNSSHPPKRDMEWCEILWSNYAWGAATFEEILRKNEDI